MSYILEALKKSDTERSVSNIPKLGTAQARHHASSMPSHWLSILIGVGIGVLLITAVFLWMDRARLPLADPSDKNADADASSISQTPPKTEKTTPTQLNSVPQSAAVSAVMSPPIADDTQSAAVVRPAINPANIPRASPPPSKEMTQSAALPRADTGPRVDELTPDVASRMPAMTINVVSFSSKPSQRFVMLNQAIYREGDNAGNGVRIDEITADGAVIGFEGGRYLITP